MSAVVTALTAHSLRHTFASWLTIADTHPLKIAKLMGDTLRHLGVDAAGAEPWAHALVGMVQNAGDWWLERRTRTTRRPVETEDKAKPRETVREEVD